VTCAFSSALIFPIAFLRSLAIGGALAALLAGATSLLLIPALLTALGPRVTDQRIIRSHPAGSNRAGTGGWRRITRAVTKRPLLIAVVVSALLITLAIPAVRMRLTGLDAGSLPRGSSARVFEERARAEFDQPVLDEIIVVAHGRERLITSRVEPYLKRFPNVAAGTVTQVTDDLWTIALKPVGSTFSSGAQQVVRSIRASPYRLTVTGLTADYLDTTSSLLSHLPLALAILLATTLALVFLITRSVLLPIKAVVMNALVLATAIGLLVLLFQDARFGFQRTPAFVLTQPFLLGAAVFGMSTDYGMFLLARIREGWHSGLTNREAVELGVEQTGRVITGAALLFCTAVGALTTAKLSFVKEAGFGIAAAVAIDATLVRILLLPSLMMLFGRWNWWRPEVRRALRASSPS
jgi:RND superfamily putative drug exporter